MLTASYKVEEERSHTLGACDDTAAVRGDVNTRDGLIMSLELVLQLESVAHFPIKLDTRILGHGQSLTIGRE